MSVVCVGVCVSSVFVCLCVCKSLLSREKLLCEFILDPLLCEAH